MYTVTFYSYKGGVGRTMALVNSAIDLAQRGKKVLIIDFDLEAPGIPTFDLFKDAAGKPGLVEYVLKYIKDRETPDVQDYLTHCTCNDSMPGKLWILPAGIQNENYAYKLNQINWEQLYSKFSGYLMFEDLKGQIKDTINPDYILIDSRTGHTDVGGICTRQMPNAVVVLFFPNDQNLRGLKQIVDDIRSEVQPQPNKQIKLHFVASNVPDLDDEDGILEASLKSFKQELSYDAPDAIIHHYNSMQLLHQMVFVKDRPKSRLTKEYQALVKKIVSNNLEDKEAAISALTEIQAILGRPDRERETNINEIEEKIKVISSHHRSDGEILYRIGIVRSRMGEEESAALLMTEAIKAGYTKSPVFMMRSQSYRALQQDDKAIGDLLSVLNMEQASERDIVFAVRWLTEIRPNSPLEILGTSWIQRITPKSRLLIAAELMYSVEGLVLSEKMIKTILDDSTASAEVIDSARHRMALNYIAQRRFSEAVDLICIGRSEASVLAEGGISDVFNYSMAMWGLKEKPERAHFERLVDIVGKSRSDDSNYNQCIGLAYAVLGNQREAYRYLDRAVECLIYNPKRNFSCWRYLEVTTADFRKDVDAIRRLAKGERVSPGFLGPTQFSPMLPGIH